MLCNKCGYQIGNDEKFCRNCGNLNPNYIDNGINNSDFLTVQSLNGVENNKQDEYINNNVEHNVNNNIENNINNIEHNVNDNIENNINNIEHNVNNNIEHNVNNNIEHNVNNNIEHNVNDNKKDNSNKKKKTIFIVVGVILLFLLFIVGVSFNDLEENEYHKDNENVHSNVRGEYSREIFSGNSFEYVTSYDTAIFTFNKDSTFEVDYDNGNSYKGTYEVYNGFYITVKANEIREDSSIEYNEALADDINDVSAKMMSEDMLNTYLLWLMTDTGIFQPFMVLYDNEINSGTIVNIYAATQGSIILK